MASSYDYLLCPDTSIKLGLVETAAKEVKPDPASSAPGRSYSKLSWSDDCRAVLRAFYTDHYSKITDGSPENNIIKRSKVKSTSGEIFELPSGKTFTLPNPSSAYVAIPLASTGVPKVEVVDSKKEHIHIPWDKGSMIYLSGRSGVKCSGNGSVVCIILALNHT